MRDEAATRTLDSTERPLESLRRAVQKSALAVGLLHLPRGRYMEMSDRARCLLGLHAADLDLVDPLTISKDPDATHRVFMLVVDGVLDGYRARRKLRVGGQEMDAHIGLRVVGRGRTALGQASSSHGNPASSDVIAIVSFCGDSPCVSGAMEGRTADYVLTSILDVVHPSDIVPVLEAFETAVMSAEAEAAVPVRGIGWPAEEETRILVRRGGGTERFGVEVGPADGCRPFEYSDRASELERRLRRIADEIEAAGLFRRAVVVPDPDRIPGLDALSSRQWEIVTRLLKGERVPRIARAMYLSPSTVRNHLSTIFRKLGVHSQAELIDRLYPPE